MSKNISGAEYPLAKIFSSDFDYVIPSYQRPYAWTVDETGELFDDLYDFYQREHEESYFLGSIVLIKEEGVAHSEVIDGQQRLTTLTILLAVLTEQLNGELRADFENYIREPGRISQGLKSKPRLSLRERDREFFAKFVQGLRFKELLALNRASLPNESQVNIQSNSALLLDRLVAAFSSNADALCSFGAFLVQRCYLVAVSTPSRRSAFRVFSVLNNRGLDLLPSDIVKADIIGTVPHSLQDKYTDKWEDLEVQTGRSAFNDLFGHIRMIYAQEKAKRSLLEEFREHVIKRVSSPESLIEDVLAPNAEAYLTCTKQQYLSTTNAQDVNRLLDWLGRIDNSDWIPSAMLFLTQKKEQSDYVLWFFKRLERLAAYLHVCAKNINQRIERYSEVLAALGEDHSLDKPISAIELTDGEKREMISALDGKIYELTPRRRNYVILRLDSFLSDGAAVYNPAVLTIEHVLPQTVSDGNPWLNAWPDENERLAWVHRIANLVPLTQRKNSEAQNYDFDTKKAVYFAGSRGVSSYALTTQVLSTPVWLPKAVENRQAALLSVFIDKWSLGNP